jgi:hypothetical protein
MLVWYIIVIAIILFWYFATKENFATKREKAEKIHDWFVNNNGGSYSKYRSALNRESNIVEYEDVRKLFDQKNFTVDSVEAVL